MEMQVRCRKCRECMKARAAQWRLRSAREIEEAPRTWFGTLTLSPSEQFKALSAARLRLSRMGIDFDRLPESEQFAERHRVIGPELTKWLKRVRKESAATLRFFLVVEAHKSGAPHYHVLIHETPGSTPVRHATLTRQWRAGFSNFKLVADRRAASYVCKYLAKSNLARCRASVGYGAGRPDTTSCHEAAWPVINPQRGSDPHRAREGESGDCSNGIPCSIQEAGIRPAGVSASGLSAGGLSEPAPAGGERPVLSGERRPDKPVPQIGRSSALRADDGGTRGPTTVDEDGWQAFAPCYPCRRPDRDRLRHLSALRDEDGNGRNDGEPARPS